MVEADLRNRAKAAAMARQAGFSVRKIAEAMQTTATNTAYEMIRMGEHLLANDRDTTAPRLTAAEAQAMAPAMPLPAAAPVAPAPPVSDAPTAPATPTTPNPPQEFQVAPDGLSFTVTPPAELLDPIARTLGVPDWPAFRSASFRIKDDRLTALTDSMVDGYRHPVVALVQQNRAYQEQIGDWFKRETSTQ